MTNYAIVTVPYCPPFKYRYLANLTVGYDVEDIRPQFSYNPDNAVLINRRSVALHVRYELAVKYPEWDFMIIDMKEYGERANTLSMLWRYTHTSCST